MTSMLAVTLVPHPAIHASGVYCIKNNAIIRETGCSCGHSHLTYVNSSLIVVSEDWTFSCTTSILPRKPWSAQWTTTSGLDILMYYINSSQEAMICTMDYNKQEGTVTNKRVCIDYAKNDWLGLWDVCGCAEQGLQLGGWALWPECNMLGHEHKRDGGPDQSSS